MSEVYGVIRRLGATSKYKGYYYVADAVKMAQGIQERPVKVTNRDVLEEIAGCTMVDKPTNSEFIDILVYYLLHVDKTIN